MKRILLLVILFLVILTNNLGAYSGGSGTFEDPYQIETLDDLVELSSTSSDWASGTYFTQTANIDASSTSSWNNGAGFIPIGNGTTSFRGHYDGQFYTISGLYINHDGDYVGLFGVASGGTIENLGLVNANVYGSNYYTGALIGKNGTAINCYSTGTVGGAMFVGGLMGAWGSAVSCYSTANVSGYSDIGGLMGIGGSATNCYATGNVNGGSSGGLIGTLEIGSVTNCYSASSSQTSGGLIAGANDPEYASVTNSFWDVTVSGQPNSFGGGTGKTTAEMTDVNTFCNSGWDFVIETINGSDDYWEMDASINSGYPFLFYENGDEELIPDELAPFSGGSGTLEDPYQIATLDDLSQLSTVSSYWASGTYFTQTANIDASSTSSWNNGAGFIPIGNGTTAFSGHYDGQFYTISGLYIIHDGDYVGLFGMASGGTIENLGLVNATVGSQSGTFVGALIGKGGTAINCYSTGSVGGAMSVGGLIGGWGSAVSCYSTTYVSGYYDIGGLMGTGGSATNCYATGNVNGGSSGGLIGTLEIGSVTNCYSASSSQTSGGLIAGANDPEYASVTNSFWDVTVSGQPNSFGGGTGKTTAEMTDVNTFCNSGWDFVIETINGSDDYWEMDASINSGYPFLFYENGDEELIPDELAPFSGGSGTLEDPYQIATLDDLSQLSTVSSYWASGTYFTQTANIDASSTSSWNNGAGFIPIGNGTTAFSGHYDGQFYTISGLYIIHDGDYVGLFGMASGGTIENLGLVNATVGSLSGTFVGALIGKNGTAINCYSSGSVSGAERVGGLIGAWGTAESCYSTANVTGYWDVGGLMGIGGSATNCYATGNVNGGSSGGLIGTLEIGSVTNCYSASSSQTSGGLIGGANDPEYASVTSSFWDVTVSGQPNSLGGGTGKTTAEMTDYTTFLDATWDFAVETANGMNDYWDIDNANSVINNGYPFLDWENGEDIAFDYTNTAPVANDIAVTTNKNVPIGITFTGSDVDGDTLTFSIVDAPDNGVFAEGVYTPNAGWYGTDTFTYVANDGTNNSEPGTVTIIVTNSFVVSGVEFYSEVNGLYEYHSYFVLGYPMWKHVDEEFYLYVSNTDQYWLLADNTLPFAYESALAWNSTQEPVDVFNPPIDGWDSWTISPVPQVYPSDYNYTPLVEDISVTTDEDTPVTIMLTGSDLNGDSLTFNLITQPSNGVLTGTIPTLTYTPNSAWTGVDSFTYIANDGIINSEEATVTITVNPVDDVLSYMVVGAGNEDVNGIYIPDGTNYHDQPRWIHSENNYYLHGNGYGLWTISQDGNFVEEWVSEYYVWNYDNPSEVPSTGWEVMYGSPPAPTVSEAGECVSYNTTMFQESEINDGTISNSITITHNNFSEATFSGVAGDDFIADGKLVISNIPSGLTAATTLISNLTLEVFLIGISDLNDNVHEPVMTITFQSSAFSTGDASSVTGSTMDVTINYIQEYFVASSGGDVTSISEAFAACGNGDLINLAGEIFTEVGLSSNKSITIQGQGAGVTIVQGHATYGAATDRVFNLTGDNITVKDLTIRNGKHPYGAGMWVQGTDVSLVNLEVCDNRAEDNVNQIGPAGLVVAASNLATIENCTIHNNTTHGIGDGALAEGGGLKTGGGGTVLIKNTTITGNICENATFLRGGAVYLNAGMTTIVNSTILNNSSGLYSNWESLTMYNTILADNSEYDIHAAYGLPLTDLGYNVVENQTAMGISPSLFTHLTNILFNYMANGTASSQWTRDNTALANQSLNVSTTLADNETLNGTSTLALLEGSFAIDAGSDADAPELDQRGFARNGMTDIGAYEFNGISNINTAPVADNITIMTDEDIAVIIELTGTDVDGDNLTFTVVSEPTNGTYADGVYTSDANWFGVDSLTYTANDGTVDSEVATVTITVNSVNDAPIADDLEYEIEEDSVVEIVLTGSDVEGDDLTFTVVDSPVNGTYADGVYTPNANYFGEDSFTFSVNDGEYLDTAQVTLTILPINDVPIALSQDIVTDEDIPVEIILTGTDVESSDMVFTIIDSTENGILTGTLPELTYTPNENYFGYDSLRFSVNDGELESESALVSIDVNPVNDAPGIFLPDAFEFNEDDLLTVDFTSYFNDVDSDTSLILTANGQTYIDVDINTYQVTFTADTNWHGYEEIIFTIDDQNRRITNLDSVIVNVLSVNDAPIANDLEFELDEDGSIEIVLTGSDVDGDDLTFTVVSEPTNGTYADGMYTPNTGWFGIDSLTYTANDGTVDSEVATVTITVNSVNDAPVANDLEYEMEEDTTIEIVLTGSDVDGDDLTFTVVSEPTNGTYADGMYTPNTGWFGIDSLTYTANDGTVDSEVATVTITVNSVNDAPVANDLEYEMEEDTTIEIVLTGSDVDGDDLTFTVVSEPTNGTYADGMYTPNTNWFGLDSLTYTAHDGNLDSEVAVVSITVVSVNDAPVADAGSDQIVEGGVIVSLDGTNSNDVDNELLYYYWTSPEDITLDDNTSPNPSFTSPLLLEDTVYPMILTVSDGLLEDEDTVAVTVLSSVVNTEVEYLSGWNMVGLPLDIGEMPYQDIYLTAYADALFSYNSSTYQSENTLFPGIGYLIRFTENSNVQYSGFSINELTYSLNEGWNIISGISTPVDVNVLYNSGIVIDNCILGYDGNYFNAETIIPGFGYWVRTSEAGEIILTDSQGLAKEVTFDNQLDDANSLTFNDGISSRTLYFGKDVSEDDRLSYSLPPVFPGIKFDARFKGGWTYTKDSGDIEMINTSSSITIAYDILITAGKNQNWVLTSESGNEYIIEGSGEIVVPTEERFTLKKQAIIPETFALLPAYPNPFNPTTTLQYHLTYDGNVTLVIYDVTGREVETLVSENKLAGKHIITWNTENISSGVYYCRLIQNDQISTQKLILLK